MLEKQIRMVDLLGQYERIKDEIDAAIDEVIQATSFIRGPFVGEFECALAGYLDVPFALGVGNGTDALQIAMMALDIGPGDEIITTPYTFIATAEAAALLGAVPIFADIDPATFNIDVSQIEQHITDKTKAIVPVHLFGQPADMDPMVAISRKYDIPIIEDLAQAIGARYKGKLVGGIGEIGTLSFFPSKNLGAYGDGGAIVTSDEALYTASRMIGNHGSKKKYFNERVGINSRLDAIQAAILKVKLKYLDEYEQSRVAAADRYDEMLAGVDVIQCPERSSFGTHVFHQYTIRYTADSKSKSRDGLAEHLKSRNIPHAIYFPLPLHKLPVFESSADRHGPLPESEKASNEVLSLPMHTELTVDEQEYIVSAVKEYVLG